MLFFRCLKQLSVLQAEQPLLLLLDYHVKTSSSAMPNTYSTSKYGTMEISSRGRGGGGGVWVAWTAPAWSGIAGARAWASDHQGVEAPRPKVFTKNDTQ